MPSGQGFVCTEQTSRVKLCSIQPIGYEALPEHKSALARNNYNMVGQEAEAIPIIIQPFQL